MNENQFNLSEEEQDLIRSIRSDAQLQSTILKLVSIGRDEALECYSADDAEESIHELGERLKCATLKGWAQSANDKEMDKALGRKSCRRSKKSPEMEVQLRRYPDYGDMRRGFPPSASPPLRPALLA